MIRTLWSRWRCSTLTAGCLKCIHRNESGPMEKTYMSRMDLESSKWLSTVAKWTKESRSRDGRNGLNSLPHGAWKHLLMPDVCGEEWTDCLAGFKVLPVAPSGRREAAGTLAASRALEGLEGVLGLHSAEREDGRVVCCPHGMRCKECLR